MYKQFIISLFLSIIFSHALFASDIGYISAIKGSAIIQREGEKIVLHKGFLLEEKDRIITTKKSKVQIRFKDDTVISIGQNSTFYIYEYLFEENQEPIATFGLFTGALRAISGKIGKIAPQKFAMHTKTATIGIRGTNFGVILLDNDAYQTFCTSGAIVIRTGSKKYVVEENFFMHSTSHGKVSIRKSTASDLEIIRHHDLLMKHHSGHINIINSSIKSKTHIAKNVTIKNSNLGTEIISNTINIQNSKIISTTKVGDNSRIIGSNLANHIHDKKINVRNSEIKSNVNIGKNVFIKNANLGHQLKGNIRNVTSTSNVTIGKGSSVENGNFGVVQEDE
ncbi:FecR domain-containing protein [Sulfurimonas sp. SAG-AH-194-I05]|nr:FecR domain-containing protein [Sulfurimonas sp. SAG-AH-194-I05]MDF1875251.1 FecR domain-containing protein [Sulfurimonas sp. SAG-AH-194-I05]